MGGRTPVLLGFGAALAAAGFGLGLLVAGGRPPVVVDRVVPHPAAAPAASPAPAVAAPATREGPAAGSAAVAVPPELREALARLLEQVPEQEVPTGTGVITGTVKTEDGLPMEGVEVSCTPEQPQSLPTAPADPGEAPAEPDPVDAAVETLQGRRWRTRAKRKAFTDAAGRFRFEGLADAAHSLRGRKKGWRFEAGDWRSISEARPGAVVEITAIPHNEVRVEISWPGAEAPKNLGVHFKSEGGNIGYGMGAGHSTVSVKPGAYTAWATGGEGEEYRSDPQSVEIGSEAETPVLRFALKGRPALRGRVLYPEGEESSQTQLFFQRLGPGQEPDPAALRSSGQGRGGGMRLHESRYSVPNIAPGRYAVGASRSWNGPVLAMEVVEVVDGPVERDLRMPPLERSEYVVLSVQGPGGEVLREAGIATGYKSRTMTSSGGNLLVNRPDGTRWVLHHPHGSAEEPDGFYWIEASSPKHGRKRAEYRRGTLDAIVIRFEEAGSLHVRLDGYRGHAFEGRLRVALWAACEESTGAWSGGSLQGENRVDAEGVQSFSVVQPGDYVVALQVDSDNALLPVAQKRVSVGSGRNDCSIRVPALHSLAITGAENWVMVRPRGEERFSRSLQVGTDGRAVLDGLPEGEYEVRSGRKSQWIRVPAATEVRL